jgi:hypothetical protein
MPRGLAKIDQEAKAAKARSDAYNSGEGFHRSLYLKDDAPDARGRFLEEGNGVWYVYTHDLPKKPGQRYADKTLCLDQALADEEADTYVEGTRECPACGIEGVNRSTRVLINFIRYDEPKLVRDAQKKPVKDAQGNYVFDGTERALVLCDFSAGTGGVLAYLESQFGPLTNHVCAIHKTGDKNNPYLISVIEANKAPDDEEKALFAKKPVPPKAINSVAPKFKSIPLMSVGDMRRAYGGAAVPAGFQGGDSANGAPVPQGNIYQQATDQAAGRGHLNLGAFGS